MNRPLSALLIAVLAFALPSPAQTLKYKGPDPRKALTQYTHEVWQSENGLPQNSVNAICQTKDGFLWLGTQEGLVRFDGVQFTVFDKNNTPAIRNNHIVSIAHDTNGVLWIGTLSEGVVSYAEGRFRALSNVPQITGTQLHHVYVDHLNRLWISTRDSGVVRVDGASVRQFTTADGLFSNNVWEVADDVRGRTWIAGEGGISVLDSSGIHSFTPKDGLAARENYGLLGSHSGEIWVGGKNGLQKFSYDNGVFRTVLSLDKKDGLPGSGVYEMITDQQGNMWIACNRGVARYYGGKLSSFTENEGLSERLVNAVFVDREGNLWIGTDGGGLNVLKDGIFTSYSMKEGMPANNMWTIFEDRQKRLWFGSDEGLVLFDRTAGIRRVYNKKDGLSHGIIWSVTQDKNDVVWVGTINGLNRIVNEKIVPLPPELRLDNTAINCIFTDRNGDQWIGSSGGGLMKMSQGKIRHFGPENGINAKFVTVITEDRKGNILAGSEGDGLFILRNDSVQMHFTTANGLASNFIHSLCADSTGLIWIGTDGKGLTVLNGHIAHTFSMKNGLFDDVIFQILPDDLGRMWFTCNKGIFRVSRSQFEEVLEGTATHVASTAYGRENGMSSSECNGGVAPAGWKSADGALWFPTARGVAMVDPKNISINSQPPLTVIEELLIDNIPVDRNATAVIPPGKERFEFRFTGLSFDGPKKVRFKVMLDGYDKGWDDVRNRRAAYYAYLPPGEYTFKVIAANSDGVWSIAPATYHFVVQAHFYQTTIFYVTITVVLTLLSGGAVRWRLRLIRRREEELERLVEERTKNLTEANEAKSQLLSFVAHDLKTPLITINSIAQEIKRFDVDKHFRGYLDLVEQNSKRIVTLISEILNITAIESGKFQFTMEPMNMADLAGLVVDGYQVAAMRKEQRLRYTVEGHEECMVNADSSKLQEAMENLVNNAIKYSPRGAEITVSVARRNGSVRFSVTDQGPGISATDQQQLFKKFSILTARPTGGEIATGLGLAIVKEIVDAHQGQISVHSEPPKGSTFIIELKKHG